MPLIPNFFGGQRNSVFGPFSLDFWDPYKDFLIPSSSSQENSAFVSTRVNRKKTPEAHVLKADLPRLKKEEIKLKVEDDKVLQISREGNVKKKDKNDRWRRVERSNGKFKRRFRLLWNVKMDQVKASMDNGAPTVIVPKQEMKQPQIKAIQISSSSALKSLSVCKVVCLCFLGIVTL